MDREAHICSFGLVLGRPGSEDFSINIMVSSEGSLNSEAHAGVGLLSCGGALDLILACEGHQSIIGVESSKASLSNACSAFFTSFHPLPGFVVDLCLSGSGGSLLRFWLERSYVCLRCHQRQSLQHQVGPTSGYRRRHRALTQDGRGGLRLLRVLW